MFFVRWRSPASKFSPMSVNSPSTTSSMSPTKNLITSTPSSFLTNFVMQHKSSASVLIVGIEGHDKLRAIERHSIPESRRLKRFSKKISFRRHVHVEAKYHNLYLYFGCHWIRRSSIFNRVHSIVGDRFSLKKLDFLKTSLIEMKNNSVCSERSRSRLFKSRDIKKAAVFYLLDSTRSPPCFF